MIRNGYNSDNFPKIFSYFARFQCLDMKTLLIVHFFYSGWWGHQITVVVRGDVGEESLLNLVSQD